jgi:hypothetical protein
VLGNLPQNSIDILSPEAQGISNQVIINGRVKVRVYDFSSPSDIAAYEQIMNKALAQEYIVRYDNQHWTKEGICLTCISWVELDDT